MLGIRRELAEGEFPVELGEYGKAPDGIWWIRPPAPGFPVSALINHTVTEHEDGTISVYASILSYGSGGKQWHGYLERGYWREV